jgi:hypothetical protein
MIGRALACVENLTDRRAIVRVPMRFCDADNVVDMRAVEGAGYEFALSVRNCENVDILIRGWPNDRVVITSVPN